MRLRLERGPALAPETFSVTLKRDDVRVSAVPEGRLLGDRRTGWVRLQEFDVQAAEDLRRDSSAFLDVLATAYERWVADGHLTDPGAPYVTPYFFPPVGGRHGGDPTRPAATIRGEIGRYAMDTMTCIGAGTWDGATATVQTCPDVTAGSPAWSTYDDGTGPNPLTANGTVRVSGQYPGVRVNLSGAGAGTTLTATCTMRRPG